ncbi:hypothetical protein ACWC24_13060 [Streptomyces sp. NPDC001443]
MDRSRLESSINRALANRTTNRPLVREIGRQWEAFRNHFEELTEAVDRLVAEATKAGAPSGDPDHALRTVEAWRRPAADGGPDPLDRLAEQVRRTGAHLAAVEARVNRDTVNIGVVGRTKAGKSTVLRAASGLDGTVLPSHQDNPTTASRSWIHHQRGKAEARVTLRTWDEFADQYLAPLHSAAQLSGRPPRDAASFRAYPYPEADGKGAVTDERSAEALPYLKKLLQAQQALDEYLPLLEQSSRRGGEHRQLVVPLEQLRPYVSYPGGRDDDGMPRLYHAVRDVHIHCDFPHLDTAAMVLVDLPGAGEAGLDVQRHFLHDLTHEVDFLLHVKRGAPDKAFFAQEDFADLHLAQLACGDVPLADFTMVVVNADETLTPESARNLLDKARDAARNYQVRTVECPLGRSTGTADAAVRERLLPVVLGHLADRLAEMDRAVFDGLRRRMSEVTRDVVGFAREVAAASEQWQLGVPDETDRLQNLVKRLRNQLAQDLAQVYEDYEGMVQRREHIPQIEAAVADAAERVRSWARTGFDSADEATWRAETKAAMYQSGGEALDLWFNRARTKLAEEFGRVDTSVDRAVALLWQRMADALRGQLTDALVPVGDQPLETLLRRVERLPVPILRQALRDFTGLRTDYGSLFLRVGSPLVQQVRHWAGQIHSVPAPRQQPPAPGPDRQGSHLSPEPPQAPPHGDPQRPVSRASWFHTPAAGPAAPTRPEASLRQEPPVRHHPGQGGVPADPAAPADGSGGYAARATASMEQLHRDLVAAVENTVSELERQLHAEALAMVRVLVAAAYQFFDATTGTPGVELEWKRVCRGEQRTIWPGEFDGAEAVLAESVSLLLKRADDVRGAGAELSAAVGAPRPGRVEGPGKAES